MAELLKFFQHGHTYTFGPHIKQEITFVRPKLLRRTIDGRLILTDHLENLKYRSFIEGTELILSDRVQSWSEHSVSVDCLHRFKDTFDDVNDARRIILNRDPVPGSLQINGSQGILDRAQFDVNGRTIHLTFERREAGESYTLTYRPRLEMRLVDFKWHMEAYEKSAKWQLILEET